MEKIQPIDWHPTKMKSIAYTLLAVALQLGCNEPEKKGKEISPQEQGRREARKIAEQIDAKYDLRRAAMNYEFAVCDEARSLRQRSELSYALGMARLPGRAELLSIQFRDKREEVESLKTRRVTAESKLKSLIQKARFGPDREDAAQILEDACDRIRLAAILAGGSVPANEEQWRRVEASRFDEINSRWKARSSAASAP